MPEGAPSSFIRPDQLWRSLQLKAEQTVVHLGCGAGFFLIPAAKIVGAHGRAIGVDVRSDMLAEAENRAEREGVADIVRTIRADLESSRGSTLDDNIADWVLIVNILHQADSAKILTEAARIVKPEGTIAVVEWDTSATPLGPPPDQRPARQEVIQTAEQAGLHLVNDFSPSPYHYGLLLSAAKKT